MGIDARHKRLFAISAGQLINQTQPVVEHGFAGIGPGVIHVFVYQERFKFELSLDEQKQLLGTPDKN